MGDISEDIQKGALLCRCLIDCPDGSDNSTCSLKLNAKCYKKIFRNEFGEVEIRAGCLGSQEQYIDQCAKLADPDFATPTVLKCCNNGTLCNDHLEVHLPTVAPGTGNSDQENWYLLVGVCVAVFFILFAALVAFVCYRFKKQEKIRKREIQVENCHAHCPRLHGDKRFCSGNCKHRAVDDMLDEWASLAGTSSGSGMPLLVQRTITKQIEVIKEIGRGRYGKVMLGKWRDENVALKIFNSTDEDSWRRETEIYQTVTLRHKNILGFIAADISGACGWTQMCLITEYHESGSLYDYLHAEVLDVAAAIKLAYTAASGLAHLHTEILGTQGKPAIAHRDVKSKNILIKSDGQCCIADMGLAVRYSKPEGKVDIGKYDLSKRQGTRRYMAPEVILQSYHPASFDAYKASDVYSFALVMWEIANRTLVKGKVQDYHLPYHDVVSNDPDIDEMKKVVVIEQMRPEMLPEWGSHRLMAIYMTVMQECWVAKFESRLSMLRLRKTLNALHEGGQKPIELNTNSSDSDRKPSASSTASIASSNETQEPLIIPKNLSPPPERLSAFVI